MRRAVDLVARALEVALALALIGAVALNFVNVVGRYGFGSTMTIADELQTYAMVWIAFSAPASSPGAARTCAWTCWRSACLRVSRKSSAWVEAALVLVLGSLVTWVAWQYVAQMYHLGGEKPDGRHPDVDPAQRTRSSASR